MQHLLQSQAQATCQPPQADRYPAASPRRRSALSVHISFLARPIHCRAFSGVGVRAVKKQRTAVIQHPAWRCPAPLRRVPPCMGGRMSRSGSQGGEVGEGEGRPTASPRRSLSVSISTPYTLSVKTGQGQCTFSAHFVFSPANSLPGVFWREGEGRSSMYRHRRSIMAKSGVYSFQVRRLSAR
jgi:hypothetical protein